MRAFFIPFDHIPKLSTDEYFDFFPVLVIVDMEVKGFLRG
jgi:hypothetical protein